MGIRRRIGFVGLGKGPVRTETQEAFGSQLKAMVESKVPGETSDEIWMNILQL